MNLHKFKKIVIFNSDFLHNYKKTTISSEKRFKMNNIVEKREIIKNFPIENSAYLKEIIHKLEIIFNGKRRIMYSDIINLIMREGIKDELSNDLILWCTFKMRSGEIYVTTR